MNSQVPTTPQQQQQVSHRPLYIDNSVEINTPYGLGRGVRQRVSLNERKRNASDSSASGKTREKRSAKRTKTSENVARTLFPDHSSSPSDLPFSTKCSVTPATSTTPSTSATLALPLSPAKDIATTPTTNATRQSAKRNAPLSTSRHTEKQFQLKYVQTKKSGKKASATQRGDAGERLFFDSYLHRFLENLLTKAGRDSRLLSCSTDSTLPPEVIRATQAFFSVSGELVAKAHWVRGLPYDIEVHFVKPLGSRRKRIIYVEIKTADDENKNKRTLRMTRDEMIKAKKEGSGYFLIDFHPAFQETEPYRVFKNPAWLSWRTEHKFSYKPTKLPWGYQ